MAACSCFMANKLNVSGNLIWGFAAGIITGVTYGLNPLFAIIGKTNRDEIQNQMRLKFARKLQKRNVTEKSHTSYSQKWLSNVN